MAARALVDGRLTEIPPAQREVLLELGYEPSHNCLGDHDWLQAPSASAAALARVVP